MDRYWFLTSTTYGTWLPGDPRGCVTRVHDGEGPRIEHDLPGTPHDADLPGLRNSASQALRGPPIWLNQDQARVLLGQFQETAAYRRWCLIAVAVMGNHVHLIVGVPGDPDPSDILGDFKSYGSRALNRRWPKPVSGTWWTEGGSKRKLPDERALFAAIRYVQNQPNALVIWINEAVNFDPGERGV